MRVLYFSQGYTTHDRRFLSKLAESQHQVFYLRLEDGGITFERRQLPASVELVEWPDGPSQSDGVEGLLNKAPQFEEILRKVSPDLVHAGPVQSCGFITALSGFHPFLVMSWGSDILLDADTSELANWITRFTLERSDSLACDCDAVLAKTNLLVDYSGRPIAQFPWGIDSSAYGPGETGLRKQLDWEGKFVVLSTRTWEPIYGIDTLLEGFRLAVAKNPNVRLLLMADGSLAPSYEEFIELHGLSHLISRPGRASQDQLPDYYRCADLYVSASLSDGSSVSLLEAMATGLPVGVTDIPGNREWVTHGEGGWLWPTGDSNALADLILAATAKGEKVKTEMGRINRLIVEDRADWDRNFPRLLETYDQLERQLVAEDSNLPCS